MTDPRRIVAAGYDAIAGAYAEASLEHRTGGTYYRRFVDRCIVLLHDGARVLDLGCGAGIVAADLARHARVIGVDRSLEQLRSEEHTSELQSRQYLVCRLLLEKKKKQ